MAKVKFIGKWLDKEYVNLEYEYRGHTYLVYENRTKGNEPLSWQHKNAQARIDHEIELEEKYKQADKQEHTSFDESLEYFLM